MGYNYTCDFNLQDCIKTLGLDEKGMVQRFVTNEVMRLSDPFVPFDTGDLKNSAHIENETDVVYKTPYARRMYYHPEYNFREKGESENGGIGRGAYWVDRMMQNGGRDAIEQGARKVAGQ